MRSRALRRTLRWGLAAALAPGVVGAEVIRVTPADGFAPIERAMAGDEVRIAPGTYRFRVFLTRAGTAERPIEIRAEDPANPPVWDLTGMPLEGAPGSYTAGDRGRGCWQVSGGAHYHIRGIVFANCHNAARNAAGIRYYAGTRGLRVTDCVFRGNDNGVTGGTQNSEAAFEHCEFDRNGDPAASAPTHNVYNYGGTFALRYSYVHDPVQGQNFHVRAHDAVIEYNWFARAHSYEGDLMTDDDDDGRGGHTQSMLLRGNVFVQSPTAQNGGQMVAMYNDGAAPGLTLTLRAIANTVVGNGGHAAFVHASNADGTRMSAEVSNNILAGTSAPIRVEDAARATVTGVNNWLTTGAAPGPLTASVFSSQPGFANAAALDFTLAPGSAAIGAASAAVTGAPEREYFRDETLTRRFRVRASARDLGAFEHTTTGPGDGPDAADGSTTDARATDVVTSDATTDVTSDVPGDGASDVPGDVMPSGMTSSGCGCRMSVEGGRWSWVFAAAMAAVGRRRRRTKD